MTSTNRTNQKPVKLSPNVVGLRQPSPAIWQGIFDELEKDPGQASLRRHRWSDPPVWGVTIRGRRAESLVLWSMETIDGEQTVVVRYIGPGIPD